MSPTRVTIAPSFLVGERERIYARRMADGEPGVMEGIAMAGALSTARPRRRGARLGRGVFALTSTLVVAALAFDVQSGSFKNVLYLGVNVVLGVIGLLLDERRPEHPISWVMAFTAFGGRLAALATPTPSRRSWPTPARCRAGSPQPGSTIGAGCPRWRCR